MIYENSQTLEQESLIKAEIESKRSVRLAKTVKFARFDYYMTDLKGNLIALTECKSRLTPSDSYPTYIISTEKLLDILYLKRFFGKKSGEEVDFILFVKFVDGKILYWKHQKDMQLESRLGGNSQRKPEMMTHIPMELFREV